MDEHGWREIGPHEAAELGARLAASEGYRVIASDGRDVGAVERLRYEHHADHPDDVVISRHVLAWRRRGVVPFAAVGAVDRDREHVYLNVSSREIKRLRH